MTASKLLAGAPLASLLAMIGCAGTGPSPAPQESNAQEVAAPARDEVRPQRGCVGGDDAGAAPSPESGADAAPALDAGTADDAGGNAGDDAGDDEGGDYGDPTPFASCSVDADCIAVDRLGCCDNGWKVAINRAETAAYDASFTCETPRPICAMYRVIDQRVAKCDGETHLCTMVAPPTD